MEERSGSAVTAASKRPAHQEPLRVKLVLHVGRYALPVVAALASAARKWSSWRE